jgi:hypothetical protein
MIIVRGNRFDERTIGVTIAALEHVERPGIITSSITSIVCVIASDVYERSVSDTYVLGSSRAASGGSSRSACGGSTEPTGIIGGHMRDDAATGGEQYGYNSPIGHCPKP